jgi:ankyrin repeat protein
MLIEQRGPISRDAFMRAAVENDTATLALYAEQGGDIDTLSADGRSALLVAIEHNNAEFVTDLLGHQPALGLEWDGSALKAAQQRGNAQITAQIYSSLIQQSEIVLDDKLKAAIEADDAPTVRRAIRQKGDPNAQIAADHLLWIACNARAHTVLRVLLEAGADPFRQSPQRSPMCRVAEIGDLVAAEMLLMAVGPNAFQRERLLSSSADNSPPLYYACIRHKIEMVTWLLRHGASPSAVNVRGVHPVAAAISAALPEDAGQSRTDDAARTLQAVLEALTDSEIPEQYSDTRFTYTPLGLAAAHNAGWAIQPIVCRGLPIDSNVGKGMSAFLKAAEFGSSSVLSEAVACGAAVLQTDVAGRNAMLVAWDRNDAIGLKNGNITDVLAQLLALGCDPDQPDNEGRTARLQMQSNERTIPILAAYDARRAMRSVGRTATSNPHLN